MGEQALPSAIRSRIVRFLLLHWRSEVIAEKIHCGLTIVYHIQKNLFL